MRCTTRIVWFSPLITNLRRVAPQGRALVQERDARPAIGGLEGGCVWCVHVCMIELVRTRLINQSVNQIASCMNGSPAKPASPPPMTTTWGPEAGGLLSPLSGAAAAIAAMTAKKGRTTRRARSAPATRGATVAAVTVAVWPLLALMRVLLLPALPTATWWDSKAPPIEQGESSGRPWPLAPVCALCV